MNRFAGKRLCLLIDVRVIGPCRRTCTETRSVRFLVYVLLVRSRSDGHPSPSRTGRSSCPAATCEATAPHCPHSPHRQGRPPGRVAVPPHVRGARRGIRPRRRWHPRANRLDSAGLEVGVPCSRPAGNGTIDDGKELFGTRTEPGVSNGITALTNMLKAAGAPLSGSSRAGDPLYDKLLSSPVARLQKSHTSPSPPAH